MDPSILLSSSRSLPESSDWAGGPIWPQLIGSEVENWPRSSQILSFKNVELGYSQQLVWGPEDRNRQIHLKWSFPTLALSQKAKKRFITENKGTMISQCLTCKTWRNRRELLWIISNIDYFCYLQLWDQIHIVKLFRKITKNSEVYLKNFNNANNFNLYL